MLKNRDPDYESDEEGVFPYDLLRASSPSFYLPSRRRCFPSERP